MQALSVVHPWLLSMSFRTLKLRIMRAGHATRNSAGTPLQKAIDFPECVAENCVSVIDLTLKRNEDDSRPPNLSKPLILLPYHAWQACIHVCGHLGTAHSSYGHAKHSAMGTTQSDVNWTAAFGALTNARHSQALGLAIKKYLQCLSKAMGHHHEFQFYPIFLLLSA